MSAKYTPGPWSVDGKSIIGPKATYILQDFGAYEGVSWIDYGNVTPEECEANKALVAAAPDLLAALKLVVTRCGPHAHDGAVARAAIDKAEGRPATPALGATLMENEK